MPTIEIPQSLIDELRAAKSITVLTGAGISAESGIPTFREAKTGLWVNYRPEDLATPEAFQKAPELVWKWYNWRRSLIDRAMPNAGHRALVELEKRTPQFSLITQNIDGLHQLAGNTQPIELHGNIFRVRCTGENVVFENPCDTGEMLPHCPSCGGLLRPDVVWFGEKMPGNALDKAVAASEACDLFLSVGTSALVEPAASLPFLALRRSASLVEINPEATPLTVYAKYYFPSNAGAALPALVRAAWPEP